MRLFGNILADASIADAMTLKVYGTPIAAKNLKFSRMLIRNALCKKGALKFSAPPI
jgi:hypothetical protein